MVIDTSAILAILQDEPGAPKYNLVRGNVAVGILLGKLAPEFFQAVGNMKLAEVNLPVAALIWLMIVPMMMKVDFTAIRNVGKRPKGLLITLVVNWLVKPFSMAFLGWLFFKDRLTATHLAGVVLCLAGLWLVNRD